MWKWTDQCAEAFKLAKERLASSWVLGHYDLALFVRTVFHTCGWSEWLSGIRVIVLRKLHQALLRELHSGHQGIAKIKAVARNYVWWPNVDKSLEDAAKNCKYCQSVKSNPTVVSATSLDRAREAIAQWLCQTTEGKDVLHASGHTFKVAGGCWNATTKNNVCNLWTARASCFTQWFRIHFLGFSFMRKSVKHIKSTPYHPSTNGLATNF